MSKAKGSRIERKCRRLLEASGHTCMKAGGSLGTFDLFAWMPDGPLRAIQVKGGAHPWCAPHEREQIASEALPAQATRELWLWKDYARNPEVIFL